MPPRPPVIVDNADDAVFEVQTAISSTKFMNITVKKNNDGKYTVTAEFKDPPAVPAATDQ